MPTDSGLDASTLARGAELSGAPLPGVLLGHGPSLDFLEATQLKNGRRSWGRTTVWVDVDENLAFIEVTRLMIRSLRGTARMRYAAAGPPKSVFLPTELTPQFLRSFTRASAHRLLMALGFDEVQQQRRRKS